MIAEELREKRPNISDSSEKTYASTLFSLNKKMGGDKELDFFKKHNEILKFIKENMVNKQTQKTLLSALLILTGLSEYREDMLAFAKEVNDNYNKKQKMTDKQREHRISFDEVKEKVEKSLSALKQHRTMVGFQQFLAAAFSSGVYAPPRRSEFANIRIKNFDHTLDNYLFKNKIIFNSYKTAKKYGRQEYTIPKEVIPFLRQYLKINKTDFLFPKKDGEASMSNVDYNRLLGKVFGSFVSVDALRSIYLSEKYKDVPSMQDMEATATAMGHSIQTGLTDYVKKE
jgi:integrase